MSLLHSVSMGKQHKKVIFLLAGWQNSLWMFWIFTFILSKKGFYCITYAYDDDIFSSDTEQTVRNMLYARDALLEKMVSLKKEGYSEFSLFGTSLGSALVLLIANVTPEISKIILNTTGGDLAETVWSWNHHGNQYFKRELQSQHITLEKLRILWAPINPIQNINMLSGKRFLIYLSKKDEVIPYFLGEQLVKKLREQNNICHVVLNRSFGHILSGIYNLCNFPVYLHFLSTF